MPPQTPPPSQNSHKPQRKGGFGAVPSGRDASFAFRNPAPWQVSSIQSLSDPGAIRTAATRPPANSLPSSSAASLLRASVAQQPALLVHDLQWLPGPPWHPLVLTTNHEGPHFQGKPHRSLAQDTCPALHAASSHPQGSWGTPHICSPSVRNLTGSGLPAQSWQPRENRHKSSEGGKTSTVVRLPLVILKVHSSRPRP